MALTGKNFFFAIFTLCIGLGALFSLDRLFGYFFPAHPVYLNKSHFTMDTYATNYRGYFKDTVSTPSGATYFTVNRTKEKDRKYPHAPLPKNTVYIAAVGDSFTYGQGVRLEDTYIKQIEKASFPRPVFGINLGVLGAGVHNALDQLKSIDKKWAPQLVIYGYVLNDTLLAPRHDMPFQYLDETRKSKADAPMLWDFMNVRTMNIEANRPLSWQRLAKLSRTVDFALAVHERRVLSRNTTQYYKDLHDPIKNSTGLNLTIDIVREMKLSAGQMGSKFLVVIFPIFYRTGKSYPFAQAHALLLERLIKEGIAVIDLAPAYASYTDEDLWAHPVDQHPNDLAHKIAAEQITNWIREQKLLN